MANPKDAKPWKWSFFRTLTVVGYVAVLCSAAARPSVVEILKSNSMARRKVPAVRCIAQCYPMAGSVETDFLCLGFFYRQTALTWRFHIRSTAVRVTLLSAMTSFSVLGKYCTQLKPYTN